MSTEEKPAGQPDVTSVATVDAGPDRYRIRATATFASAPDAVWALLCDWERLVAVGLPGLTSGFRWLGGGPGLAPSRFRFEIAGTVLDEEIYELTARADEGRYRLRYRALEPALGVVEYDAAIELRRNAEGGTAFSAVRDVRLEPGTTPQALEAMIDAETRRLEEHFRR